MRRKGSRLADSIMREYDKQKEWQEKQKRIKEENRTGITMSDKYLREPLITKKEEGK